MNSHRACKPSRLATGIVVVLGLLPLGHANQLPSLWSVVLYLAGLLFLLHGPGLFLVRLLRLRVRGAESSFLSLSLGIVSASLSWRVAGFFGSTTAFFAWPAAALSGLLVLTLRREGTPHRARVALRPYLVVLLVTCAVLAPMTVLPHFATDFVVQHDGSMEIAHRGTVKDAILHASVANELTHSARPGVPFFAGKQLDYHYGMDLLTAAFHRVTGIPSHELTLRYLPSLYLGLLVLAVASFTRRWLGSFAAGIVAAFLVILGENLSYLPGLAWGSDGAWTADFFRVPTIYSLYTVNPMSLALVLLFGGLFCLLQGQMQMRQRMAWVWLAGLHFAVMGTVKVFVLLQLLPALLCVALFAIRRCDGYWLKALLVVLACAALLVGPSIIAADEPRVMRVAPDGYSAFLLDTLQSLKLGETPGFRAAAQMLGSRSASVSGVAATVLLALPLFFLGAFGIRLIGVADLGRPSSLGERLPCLTTLLALFVVGGCILTLMLKITPVDVADDYNNSVWFMVQSEYVAWLFAVRAITRWDRAGHRRRAALLSLAVVLLALPASVQFFVHVSRARRELQVGPEALKVVDFFRRDVPPGAVVLSRQEEIWVPLQAMTPSRAPYHPVFTRSFVRREGIQKRTRRIGRFWADWDKGRLNGNIAAELRLEYVVSRAPARGLAPCFDSGSYRVYRLGVAQTAAPRPVGGKR